LLVLLGLLLLGLLEGLLGVGVVGLDLDGLLQVLDRPVVGLLAQEVLAAGHQLGEEEPALLFFPVLLVLLDLGQALFCLVIVRNDFFDLLEELTGPGELLGGQGVVAVQEQFADGLFLLLLGLDPCGLCLLLFQLLLFLGFAFGLLLLLALLLFELFLFALGLADLRAVGVAAALLP